MQGHYQTFARYNAWANIKLYSAVNELPYKEIYKQRECAYFGSIIGTLNHILVGDRIWLSRIDGTGPGQVALDALVYDEFDDLQEARRTEDRRIMALVDRFEDTHLAYPITYKNMAGEGHSTPLGQILAHLFNHQTHHRGQVHGMIKEAGAEPPAIDLIYYLWKS